LKISAPWGAKKGGITSTHASTQPSLALVFVLAPAGASEGEWGSTDLALRLIVPEGLLSRRVFPRLCHRRLDRVDLCADLKKKG
jgi:hypothetical protein